MTADNLGLRIAGAHRAPLQLEPSCHTGGHVVPQIFHRSTNAISRFTIFGSLVVIAAVTLAWGGIIRAPYVTEQDVVRDQPVPFSHEHHVAGLGIDCRYCHTTVENSSYAGLPSTKTCMTCHSQTWTNA